MLEVFNSEIWDFFVFIRRQSQFATVNSALSYFFKYMNCNKTRLGNKGKGLKLKEERGNDYILLSEFEEINSSATMLAMSLSTLGETIPLSQISLLCFILPSQ